MTVVANKWNMPSKYVEDVVAGVARSFGFDDLGPEYRPGTTNIADIVPDALAEADRERVLGQLMTNGELQTLYGEYDRLRAEAKFRAAIFIPLVLLIAILAVRLNALWAILALGPMYLLIQARIQTQRAEDVLTSAVPLGAELHVLRDFTESLREAWKRWDAAGQP